MHVAGDDGVAGAVCSVPAGQAVTERHALRFGIDEYVPGAQSPHCRFVDTLPAAVT